MWSVGQMHSPRSETGGELHAPSKALARAQQMLIPRDAVMHCCLGADAAELDAGKTEVQDQCQLAEGSEQGLLDGTEIQKAPRGLHGERS